MTSPIDIHVELSIDHMDIHVDIDQNAWISIRMSRPGIFIIAMKKAQLCYYRQRWCYVYHLSLMKQNPVRKAVQTDKVQGRKVTRCDGVKETKARGMTK